VSPIRYSRIVPLESIFAKTLREQNTPEIPKELATHYFYAQRHFYTQIPHSHARSFDENYRD